MEVKVNLTLEESSLLRNSLDVIQIQGKNAKMVANLQDKLEESIFQLQMNIQMAEEEKKEKEAAKLQQLEELKSQEEAKKPTPSRGRKPKS